MQTTKNTSRTLQKLFGVVIAGAFAVAPFAGAITPVEAAPVANERREYQTLEGVVTVDQENNRRFTLRLNNGRRIQVRTAQSEPVRLSTGDRVRVRGFFRRNQANVFRAESVRIITNRNTGNTRTFRGTVVDIETNQRFDIDVNGRIYNVIASTRLPRRLNEGDEVRVYGRRSGDNNIVNATVVIINNDGDDDNDNNDNNGYRTYTGRVEDVDSDQRFELDVNGTNYDVLTSSRLPRGLDEGDTVRVYGRRSGDNNITNATVSILDNN